jgi:hypothetical protein
MSIHPLDRRGQFEVRCNADDCSRRMTLRPGDLLLSAPPRLSPRVNWQQTDDGSTYCPEHAA